MFAGGWSPPAAPEPPAPTALSASLPAPSLPQLCPSSTPFLYTLRAIWQLLPFN